MGQILWRKYHGTFRRGELMLKKQKKTLMHLKYLRINGLHLLKKNWDGLMICFLLLLGLQIELKL